MNRSRIRILVASAIIALGAAIAAGTAFWPSDVDAHGGGLNKCGCHFNRKTGECHCHQDRGCGCSCQPDRCSQNPS